MQVSTTHDGGQPMDTPAERALGQAECSGCHSVLHWVCPQMNLSPGPLGVGVGPRIPTRWPPLNPGQPDTLTTFVPEPGPQRQGGESPPKAAHINCPIPLLPAHAQGRPPALHLTQGLSLVPWGMAPRAWSSQVAITNTTYWGLKHHLLLTVPEAASPE